MLYRFTIWHNSYTVRPDDPMIGIHNLTEGEFEHLFDFFRKIHGVRAGWAVLVVFGETLFL